MSRHPVILHLLRAFWVHSRAYRKRVVLYIVLSFVSIFAQLAAPLLMASLMNSLSTMHGAQLESQAWQKLLLYAGCGVLFWALHGPSRVMEMTIAFHIRRIFQVSLMSEITELPTRWHQDHHSGETIDQVSRAVQALGEFAERGFELLHLVSRFLGSLVLLTWLMPSAGVVMFMATLGVAFIIIAFDRILVPQYEEINRGYNRVASAVQDYLTNISTVISLRLESRVTREVADRLMGLFDIHRKNIVLNEWKWFTTARVVDFSQAGLLLYLIVSEARSGRAVQVGTVYAVSEYLRNLGDTFYNFAWKYGTVVVQSARVRGVDHIERAYEQFLRRHGAQELPAQWHALEVTDLRMKYEDTVALSIDRLRLERGKSYALVGESGGGKSTLLSVLRGLHEPLHDPGVCCDGVDFSDGLFALHHQTTLIPQDPEIFSDTVRFNITLGMPCEDERIQRAVELACFDKVLERLPRGLESNIAEKGVSLSGGERQRLALARGFFFEQEIHSNLVLLDEPTSSVDITNERRIYRRMLAEYKDRCVISSLHKFHLLDLFDEVILVREGSIVVAGPVEELKSREPLASLIRGEEE